MYREVENLFSKVLQRAFFEDDKAFKFGSSKARRRGALCLRDFHEKLDEGERGRRESQGVEMYYTGPCFIHTEEIRKEN